MNLRNSLDSQVFGEIPRFPRICGIPEISQIPIGIRRW